MSLATGSLSHSPRKFQFEVHRNLKSESGESAAGADSESGFERTNLICLLLAASLSGKVGLKPRDWQLQLPPHSLSRAAGHPAASEWPPIMHGRRGCRAAVRVRSALQVHGAQSRRVSDPLSCGEVAREGARAQRGRHTYELDPVYLKT